MDFYFDPDNQEPKKPKIPATKKAMDLLAVREHSAFELRQKLVARGYEELDIDQALSYVEKNGWVKPVDEMITTLINKPGLKDKSVQHINMKLEAMGLPPVAENSEEEYEKALHVVEKKSIVHDDLDLDEKLQLKAKTARLLQSRGFSEETIERVLNEKYGS